MSTEKPNGKTQAQNPVESSISLDGVGVLMQLSVNSHVVTDKPSNGRRESDCTDDVERMSGRGGHVQPKAESDVKNGERQKNPSAATLDLARNAWLKSSAKQIRKQESAKEDPRANIECQGEAACEDRHPTEDHAR